MDTGVLGNLCPYLRVMEIWNSRSAAEGMAMRQSLNDAEGWAGERGRLVRSCRWVSG